ncbi:hypothetical protein BXZ70DRAFT_1007617 [Cristinia sonorae]|uniref:Uncharacterized protein n=1 Tax=Cristinia sonorae TaxID=1940300 RepID=A0A8K0UPH9_9AGAR|nr:hypothetical protein BXZ70DRAFT_1007617 [Cristinia sonorae]
MVFLIKPSLPILLISSTTAINLFILLATIWRLLAPELSVDYTWIDRDNPIMMPTGPIPTVERTFQESIRFTLDDDSSKPNWETLFTNQFGIGFQHLGPYHYRYISAAYHSQHCVYSMALDFDKPNHRTHPSHHFIHCLMYMRQIFMCDADMTLEDGDFTMRNLTLDRMGATRECKDWNAVSAWVNQNFKEWADYNGVSFDD